MKKNFEPSSITREKISSFGERAVEIWNFLFRADFWNTLYVTGIIFYFFNY